MRYHISYRLPLGTYSPHDLREDGSSTERMITAETPEDAFEIARKQWLEERDQKALHQKDERASAAFVIFWEKEPISVLLRKEEDIGPDWTPEGFLKLMSEFDFATGSKLL